MAKKNSLGGYREKNRQSNLKMSQKCIQICDNKKENRNEQGQSSDYPEYVISHRGKIYKRKTHRVV